MPNTALLVGINYVGTSHELSGCANDVRRVNALLKKNQFKSKDITIVSDDYAEDPFALEPSRNNILDQLKQRVRNAKHGDIVFFHYSGHGTYTYDRGRDEADGRDEALCPTVGRNIKDDDLKKIIDELPVGAKFFGLIDCCHSGSMFDLEHNLGARETTKPNKTKHGYTVMISGCQDNQTSMDAWINGRYQGAMTASFMQMVEQYKGLRRIFDICFSNSKREMRDLRTNMFDWLTDSEFVQKPNIAFEGLLPPPILEAYRVSRYNLRQTPAREERAYKEVEFEYRRLGM